MFLFEQPTAGVLEKNYQELGMTPDTIKRDVGVLREWMSKQPHLPEITDDVVFERFLTHCKNSIERAKMKLDAYYSVRTAVPEFYQNRDPEDPAIKASVDSIMYCVLPKTTPEGDRVTILKLFDPDPNKYDPVTVFKTAIMLTDANFAEDLCRKHILVYDISGATMAHAAALSIPILKKFLTSGSIAMPQRFSGFHILNAPSFTEALITLAKSFIKVKLAQRVHVHSKDLSTLYNFIPRDILPKEYGGSYDKTMEELRDLSYKSMLIKRDWFLAEEKLRSDESKRPAKSENGFDLDYLGIEGSFRNIVVD